MGDEFSRLDATDQARLVASGEVTAGELVEAAIQRIETLNPELNAVIHPLFDKARQNVADDALPDGPFRGVPFLVKDAVCHTAGDPYHLGMRFLKERGHIAKDDTELARRFRAAGFVFVGKTNTPELAMSCTTEPLAYGATHNPWDLDRSPGGSSGGSAAAVAAGLVPVAHANDMGGSIRIPASHCGLVGLKPTRGRSTLAPHFSEFWGPLTHEHVVTRSVRDCAAVLDAIAGPAPGDPYTAPPPIRPFAEEVGATLEPLRIGVLRESSIGEVDPRCAAAVDETAQLLESLGHRVEAAQVPALSRLEMGPWIQAGIARDLDRWSQRLGEKIGQGDVEPINWLMAEIGRRMSAADYVEQAENAFTWAREVTRPFGDAFTLLLTPTSAIPPPKLGWCAPGIEVSELLQRLSRSTLFTMPWNVTGQPAISLPLQFDDEGLPIGVQFIAPSGREDLLFRLAAQLEEAQPWRNYAPPLHA